MRFASTFIGTSALALLLTGCSPQVRASLPELQTRAAFDLSCAPNQLRLYHLSERTKGVYGCNRRLTYIEVCDNRYGSRCSWLLDAPANPPATVVYHPPRTNTAAPSPPTGKRSRYAPAHPALPTEVFDPGF